MLTSWLASPPPDAAVEIAPGRVSAATMTLRGDRPVVQACAAELLPDHAVVASLTSSNIVDRAPVAAALRTVLDRVGGRLKRVALIIPDVAARVSVVRFERVPERRDDLDQLVRWQVRKAAPFPIDEACVTYTPGVTDPAGGAEFIVLLARQDVVKGYEDVCAQAGVHAGLVDIATFSVVNLALASAPALGDWLLVHMRPEYTSIGIVRDGNLIFFRNRPEGNAESLADVVHETAMYYQDRLAGQGFSRVLVGGTGEAVEAARHSLEERLGTPVEALDPTLAAPVADRISVSADVKEVLAPLAGILLRTRAAAVPA